MCVCCRLVFSEDIHSKVLNPFLENHCGQGQDEPDWPCLCVWGLWFALGTLPCLFDLSALTYSCIGGQIRCCLPGLRWVSRSAEGWPEDCFHRNLLKLARSFALDISSSGTNHLELWMSLVSFLASLLSVLGCSFSPSICSQCFLAFREFLCLIYGGFFSFAE